jgi:hypothetical protein
MWSLVLPLRDPELRRRLLLAAQRDERSPVQQALFILRRALPTLAELEKSTEGEEAGNA